MKAEVGIFDFGRPLLWGGGSLGWVLGGARKALVKAF